MSRYFFDSQSGGDHVKDDIGIEFSELREAKRAAETALVDMARDQLAAGPLRGLVIQVRDEKGKVVLSGSLILHLEEPRNAN